MADNHFKIHKGMTLAPQSSAPANPIDGDMYYDDTLNEFRKYENGSWQSLGAANLTGYVNENFIINGAMEFSQRGSSFASIADGSYFLDRYRYRKVGAAVHTASQDTDVPNTTDFIFQNSLRLNLTTPDTSIASGDFVRINQFIEGYNWAKLAQKTFTLSFWVKATTTGTYCVSFINNGGDRSYVSEYTINSSDTWEQKTITISPSPSAGTWDYTNGRGLEVIWTLAAGSTFQTTADAWQTGTFYATSNQINGVNTGATNFRLTGIQITEGTEALPFRRAGKDITNELQLCQRYLSVAPGRMPANRYGGGPGNVYSSRFYFPVEMRATPSFVNASGVTVNSGSAPAPNQASILCDSPSGYVTYTISGTLSGTGNDTKVGDLFITYNVIGNSAVGVTATFFSNVAILAFDAEL